MCIPQVCVTALLARFTQDVKIFRVYGKRTSDMKVHAHVHLSNVGLVGLSRWENAIHSGAAAAKIARAL